MERYYPFQLDPLNYRFNELEPVLDLQTVLLHYSGCQQSCARQLNAALEPWPRYHSWSLARLLAGVNHLPPALREPVRRYGGRLFAHQLYFSSMTPPAGQQPDAALAALLRETFGSAEGPRRQFAAAAAELPGAGWVWLAADRRGRLQVLATRDNETPLPQGLVPLLCCDLWEHAYFLQYKNQPERYLDAWWGLVDWQEVGERYRQRDALRPAAAPRNFG